MVRQGAQPANKFQSSKNVRRREKASYKPGYRQRNDTSEFSTSCFASLPVPERRLGCEADNDFSEVSFRSRS
jgi:hypothetical protein